MDARRQELLDELESYYRGSGWKVERPGDGTVRAHGLGGVVWIGLAVVPGDLAGPDLAERLVELSEQRMPRGELCPLELLPDGACERDLRELLATLRLDARGHVAVYALAA